MDVGKEVPAHLYQGGGHKLLLGLAFKLAIVKTVGTGSFILLDEPTYGLDREHREALLNRICEMNVAKQILLVTHDIEDVQGSRIVIRAQGNTSIQEVA